MKTGVSRLYELRPDPFDGTQRKFLRICLFSDTENSPELRELVRTNVIDAALIRAELVLEPFVLLAAANRAIHQSAHNRISTKSLSAELIYSLSPTRNISESLNTFGIASFSRALIVAIFDDLKGKKMVETAKRISGKPIPLERLNEYADEALIKQIYQLPDPELNDACLSDMIVSRIISKDTIA